MSIFTLWERDTPEYDGLFAHVEVVFTQLVLHNHRNSRGQRLCSEHVELPCLALSEKKIVLNWWHLKYA